MGREVDARTGNREDFVCPICGEAFGTIERWIRHVRYQQIAEKIDGWPIEGSHLSIAEETLQMLDPAQNYLSPFKEDRKTNGKMKPSQAETEASIIQKVREHFENEISEVLCIVEGIDPFLSGTFQAVHSYQIQDIVFEATARFRPCLDVSRNSIRVNLDRFHEIDSGGIDEAKDTYPHRRDINSSSPSRVGGTLRKKRIRTSSACRHDGVFE